MKCKGITSKLSIWMIGLVFFISLTSICLSISHVVITSESLVITFIGVLATFIVVGNFAQAAEIRSNTEKQIKGIESQLLKSSQEIQKISEILDKKTSEIDIKIDNIEKRTNYNSAEGYRLYGNLTFEKNIISCQPLIIFFQHIIIIYRNILRVRIGLHHC